VKAPRPAPHGRQWAAMTGRLRTGIKSRGGLSADDLKGELLELAKYDRVLACWTPSLPRQGDRHQPQRADQHYLATSPSMCGSLRGDTVRERLVAT
jgi:hypothetical protein